jgi:hypothetical protein
MPKGYPRDLTNLPFGRLFVMSEAASHHERRRWLCMCTCGRRTIVEAHNLLAGRTRSCGCGRTKHGRRETPEYQIYKSTKRACKNPNHKSYVYYGGRGIEFRFTSFDQFFAELGERPKGKVLARINTNGHFEPGNVRWTTRIEVNNNRRNNRRLTAFGRALTLAQWSRETGIKFQTIQQRLLAGWPVEKAVTLSSQSGGLNKKSGGDVAGTAREVGVEN